MVSVALELVTTHSRASARLMLARQVEELRSAYRLMPIQPWGSAHAERGEEKFGPVRRAATVAEKMDAWRRLGVRV